MAVSHADEYRERLEEYELIQRAIPHDERHGPEGWLMSLR